MKRVERAATGPGDFQLRHWEDRWQGWSLETIEAAIRWEGILPLARRAFPAGSRLLEAGCGTGKYCIALSRLGYDVTGIDFAQSGLDVMRRIAPAIPAVLGSVLDLPFAGGDFDGALSLGVVEHFEEGPQRALAELARVVRRGGALLLTVPFQYRLGDWFGVDEPRGVFYQYLYRRHEIAAHVRAAGFEIRSVHYLAKQLGVTELGPRRGAPGVIRTSPLGRAKQALKRRAPRLTNALRSAQLRLVEGVLPGPWCAHTIAFIARRR